MADKRFYVISYDIVDNRKRFRAAETLKDYGQRAQKSVFEAKLDADTLSKMLARLEEIMALSGFPHSFLSAPSNSAANSNLLTLG